MTFAVNRMGFGHAPVVLSIVLLVLGAFGCTGSSAEVERGVQNMSDGLAGGILKGMVTGEDTGLPVSFIDVIIRDMDDIHAEFATDTEVNGEFLAENIPPGLYSIDFIDYNHQYKEKYLENIEVKEGQVTEIEVVLAATNIKDGSLGGTVTDASTGYPLPGVTVDVFGDCPVWIEAAGETDEAGRYLISGLFPAGYEVTFRHDDYIELKYDDFVYIGNGQDKTLDIALERRRIVYGDVNNNGQVDIGDAILVLRHLTGLVDIAAEYGPLALIRAKVSSGTDTAKPEETTAEPDEIAAGSEEAIAGTEEVIAEPEETAAVTLTDAILILRYIVGLITEFPVESKTT